MSLGWSPPMSLIMKHFERLLKDEVVLWLAGKLGPRVRVTHSAIQ